MAYYNRRLFLQGGCAGFLGAAGALSSLSARPAQAASSTGYKALVGIFLKGGIDTFDMILPHDDVSLAAFSKTRQGIMSAYKGASARTRDNLLALDPVNAASFGGRTFAFAPELSAIHPLFASGEAAVVGNVGPLIEPTDRAGMVAGRQSVPDKLFSHNDQQSTWMSFGVEGMREGWGGLFSDYMQTAAKRPEFSAMAASNLDVFLSGKRTRPFRMPSELDSLDIDVLARKWRTSGNHGEKARALVEAYLQAAPDASASLFGQDVVASRVRGIRYQSDFVETFSNGSLLGTTFPDSGLGRQLGVIANSINMQSSFGNPRQIFYATMGGFDTHDNQSANLPGRLRQISEAVAAFREAMLESGQWDDVTVFTMSDFGRTLTDNGNGTDHGWGSHHLVFGGSVQGNRIYGNMPDLDPASDRFTKSRARLIPDVSVDQYASTLGSWFGLEDGELDTVLPNISRFETRNLGFMGGAAV